MTTAWPPVQSLHRGGGRSSSAPGSWRPRRRDLGLVPGAVGACRASTGNRPSRSGPSPGASSGLAAMDIEREGPRSCYRRPRLGLYGSTTRCPATWPGRGSTGGTSTTSNPRMTRLATALVQAEASAASCPHLRAWDAVDVGPGAAGRQAPARLAAAPAGALPAGFDPHMAADATSQPAATQPRRRRHLGPASGPAARPRRARRRTDRVRRRPRAAARPLGPPPRRRLTAWPTPTGDPGDASNLVTRPSWGTPLGAARPHDDRVGHAGHSTPPQRASAIRPNRFRVSPTVHSEYGP
ncbi:hypothetical protein SAMN05216207_105132 [Pseudonocardia ammonioxydans]|uniref:Uncharacterized protein n=1 Tax=Pseudonocardia ammonioxydans TaxID=260086 RepID=A0A1I5GWK1_PSUAM|nr:hypothetical protein SAMN05216207_105132 [Pseudonocardia ammonioxydans]